MHSAAVDAIALPTTHCLLPTTHYPLPAPYYPLPTSYYPLQSRDSEGPAIESSLAGLMLLQRLTSPCGALPLSLTGSPPPTLPNKSNTQRSSPHHPRAAASSRAEFWSSQQGSHRANGSVTKGGKGAPAAVWRVEVVMDSCADRKADSVATHAGDTVSAAWAGVLSKTRSHATRA